jgi:hypothetical protein
MAERLMAKLDRLGAEAGIKQMTPEIYKFSQLLNDDKLKQWDEWRSQRTWVGLTDEEATEVYAETEKKVNEHWESGGTTMMFPPTLYKAIEAKLKEKNT